MDIQVGDRVTYLDTCKIERITIIRDAEMVETFKIDNGLYIEILKIERPKYEAIEEKKELLTEEEKQFLQQYIKIIENLNNGKVVSINRSEIRITVYLKTGLSYYIEVGTKFSNMQQNTTYTLKELGVEKVEE